MLILLALLFQVKGYAVDAVNREILTLEQERDQLIQTRREMRDDVAQTIGFLDEGIAELNAAKDLLALPEDREAIATINREILNFTRQREAVLARAADLASHDFQAEIAALDAKILSLRNTIRKLPIREN